MPQQLNFSDLEQPAPAKIKKPSNESWFTTYGGYIIETKWNSSKRQYETIYHPYNYPNTSLMPNE